ncbi:C-factor [Chelonia mydas]|uniref:C-factor n=1 Tax=Chelonia mydas TaxID=8469 RepID=M7AVW3_CHEMY|nr:C-factor [Chelonia mydas]
MAGLSLRRVLLTGSNRGIGLELVKQLLGKSNPPQWVFATCQDPEGARGQLDGLGLNLVINNAGIFCNLSLAMVDSREMLGAYKTNVVGPMLVGQTPPVWCSALFNVDTSRLRACSLRVLPQLCRSLTQQTPREPPMTTDSDKAFLPLLKKAAQGSSQNGLSCSKAAIVNISSFMGSIDRVPETFSVPAISYRCSKAALNMLTRCQAPSYAEDGILCTAVHPGWVKTDMGTQEAHLPVDESVRGILAVLPTLSEKHSGSLWSWTGKTIPW